MPANSTANKNKAAKAKASPASANAPKKKASSTAKSTKESRFDKAAKRLVATARALQKATANHAAAKEELKKHALS